METEEVTDYVMFSQASKKKPPLANAQVTATARSGASAAHPTSNFQPQIHSVGFH